MFVFCDGSSTLSMVPAPSTTHLPQWPEILLDGGESVNLETPIWMHTAEEALEQQWPLSNGNLLALPHFIWFSISHPKSVGEAVSNGL